ncbi:DUF2778 domain-containing protein [Alsobacter sp. R-9]
MKAFRLRGAGIGVRLVGVLVAGLATAGIIAALNGWTPEFRSPDEVVATRIVPPAPPSPPPALAAVPPSIMPAVPPDRPAVQADPVLASLLTDPVVLAAPGASAAFAPVLGPHFVLRAGSSEPAPVERPAPHQASPEVTASLGTPANEPVAAPVPPARPQVMARTRASGSSASVSARPVTAAAAPATESGPVGLLRRLFGPSEAEKGPALAYAPSDDGGLRGMPGLAPPAPAPQRDRPTGTTAVYDISAKTVTMPDGRRLEAHSGLGELMDDVRSVKVKNRGVTPPNVYTLRMRERLFHGVRAIRLIPEDERKMHGRDGMLAHSYMLGPRGDSNGCVSFRDYDAFLNAFLRGEVTRLVVVESANATLAMSTR